MDIIFDEYITFPETEHTSFKFDKLRDCFDCVEAVEIAFEIEFSCGDGKFLSDDADFTEEELQKYDGNVCLKTPPRFTETKKLFKVDKPYRFTIKYYENLEEVRYFLNGRETSRTWIN